MAFNQDEFIKKYTPGGVKTGFDVNEFAKKYSPTTTGTNFDVNQFASKYSTSSKDIKTSSGLYNLAKQSGLQSQADKVLADKGEETQKIFSGGVISDVFDTLNTLQYGVVGTLKGKGFSEGVRTRQSWSDQDALGDYGLPGVVAGIALDIVCDPLTYVAPWTIAKKIPAVSKLAKIAKTKAVGKMVTKTAKAGEKTIQYQGLEGGSKAGKYLADKFVYMFGKDPVYKEAFERGVKNIGVSSQGIAKLTKGIIDLPKEKAALLLTKDETGRFIRKPLASLKGKLTNDELFNVAKSYAILDDLGKQAVDLNLLSKVKWEENLGEYIKNAYTQFETAKKVGWGFKKAGIKGIKSRVEELTPEAMEKLGQIDNPAYLLGKSMFDLSKDIENAKLFQLVSKQFGSPQYVEGFAEKMIPKTTKWGELGGKFVPKNIYDDLTELIKPVEKTLGNKIVAGFKYSKVILNPATHARNVISNKVLNWWKLGMNPLDPRTIKVEKEALTEIAKKGGKYMDEAKTVGYNLNTFASNELMNLLESPEGVMAIGSKSKTIANKFAKLYQGEENFAKLSAFIFNRGKGLGIEDAWRAAESATFNYAQVTPFVRKLRTSIWGYPFITFALKSAPTVAETAVKFPRRISAFGKIKTAIENQSNLAETARERASEPQWIRDGFYIKLPIKDKHGRSAYFDLTYIIPFGDLASGQLFERGINRETGLPESVPSAVLQKSPFLNIVKELAKNQDFYGDRVWKESDSTEKQLGDIMRYLTKSYSPPLLSDQIPGGYMTTGERRLKGIRGALTPEDQIKQQRTLMEELLRNVGMKVQPIDADIQETYMEWEKKKALQSLLRDAGILSEFSTMYVPKK